MAVNRAERLLDLVAALLDARRPLTREELEREVPGYEGGPEARRRNFERDKELLRAMGIPIRVEPLDPVYPELGDGYRIHPEEYALPDPGLTTEELAALNLAASLVRVEGGAAVEAIWKLGGAPTGDAAVDAVVALPGSDHMATMWEAAAERRVASFRYRGEGRRIEPWRVEFRNGRWYVTGCDLDRGAKRQFRLDRIEGTVALGAPGAFDRPPEARAEPVARPWEMGDEEPVTARVLVDAEQVREAERRAGSDAVVEHRTDGSVVLELVVSNTGAFRTFVLAFLDRAEVLDPPELRDDVVRWAAAVAGG